MDVAEQAVINPLDWPAAGSASDWRHNIGSRTRQLWDTFSDDLKVALAEDAHESLAPGAS